MQMLRVLVIDDDALIAMMTGDTAGLRSRRPDVVAVNKPFSAAAPDQAAAILMP
jgi:hypothetical protein